MKTGRAEIVKTKIAVLGAGPGGYVAAIRAAQLGAEVTVIEAQSCLPRRVGFGQ